MNLLDLFVKVGVKDETQSGLSKIAGAVGSGLATAAKVGVAAVGAAGVAIAGLTKTSIQQFAEYEQLVGGVETLFGQSAQTVVNSANEAFRTAGLSANDYMETVTSFSASLLQGLGGDTAKAAEISNMAITDMADNANKMGTSMESIQNAYQGFAKQNYTMLDNLKLGYGGTQAEMVRLINDSGILGKTIKNLDGITFDQMIQAIHQVQTNMGITGTTAKEASTTISGSIASMKAAWNNLLTGMSGGTEEFAQNLDSLIDNLVDSIIGVENEAGERVGGVLNNVMPAVEKTLNGIGKLVEGIAPIIAQKLPAIVNTLLPSIASSIVTIVQGAAGIIPTLVTTLTGMLPQILDAGFQIIAALAKGILQNLPQIVEAAVNAITQFVEYLTDHAEEAVNGAIAIIGALARGLIQSLPQLIVALGHLLEEMIAALLRRAGEFAQIGWDFIKNLASGILQMVGSVGSAIGNVVQTIWNGLIGLGSMGWNWGSDLMSNFIAGIQAWFGNLAATVRNVAATVKSYIGFSEPEKGPLSNFHTFAPDMMRMFADGIEDNEHLIGDAFNRSLDLGTASAEMPFAGVATGSPGRSAREIVLNITEMIDGAVLARNQYRYNLDESERHGDNLIVAYA